MPPPELFARRTLYLRTERVPIAVADQEPAAWRQHASPLTHLYVHDQWFSFAAADVLWLPPEYRALRSDVHRNTVALGLADGRLAIIEFDPPKIGAGAAEAAAPSDRYVWRTPPLPRPVEVKKWKGRLGRFGFPSLRRDVAGDE